MIWHLSCRQHGDVENETIRIVPNMEQQYEILAEFPIWDIYMCVTVVHIIIGHVKCMS